MHTLQIEADIPSTGWLNLNVPVVDLPSGKAQILLVINPITSFVSQSELVEPIVAMEPPYPSLEGLWEGAVDDDFDIDDALQEIRDESAAKLDEIL